MSWVPIVTVAWAFLLPQAAGAQDDWFRPRLLEEPIRHDTEIDPAEALGPIIDRFYRVHTCPYPDPEATILAYHIGRAPDGALASQVEIRQLRPAERTRVVFRSPGADGGGVRVGTSSIRDPAPFEDGTAYVLAASDLRGRTTARRLDFRYWSMNPEAEFPCCGFERVERITGERRTYAYTFRVRWARVAVAGVRQLALTLIDARGRAHTAPVENPFLTETWDGWTYPLRYPRVYASDPQDVALQFESPVYLSPGYANWNGESYRGISLILRLDVYRPDACSRAPNIAVARLDSPPRETPEEKPPPPPEDPPAYDGYPYHVWCLCTNTFRTEEVRARACLANPRGVGIVCGLVRDWVGATSCKASRWQQLEKGAPSCRAVTTSIRLDPE